jgi:hypothetical protein
MLKGSHTYFTLLFAFAGKGIWKKNNGNRR